MNACWNFKCLNLIHYGFDYRNSKIRNMQLNIKSGTFLLLCFQKRYFPLVTNYFWHRVWTSGPEPTRSRSGLFLCPSFVQLSHPSPRAEFSHETSVWFHFLLLGWFPFFGLRWLYLYTLHTGSSFQMSIAVVMTVGAYPESTPLSCSVSPGRVFPFSYAAISLRVLPDCVFLRLATIPLLGVLYAEVALCLSPEISQFERPTF